MRYVALLRGINVGGKNKVPMADLKGCFEAEGYENVKTYINSGNVIFDSEKADLVKLVESCEQSIEKQFGFAVRVSVVSGVELQAALENAPKWWDNDPDSKHNAIFVIAPATAEEIMKTVGEAKPEYEKIAHFGNVIFWSAPIKTFSRTRWSGIVGSSAYKDVTIRNSNTAKKLLELIS
jgi:uncharacterized protein (DUF1697 family)